MEAINYTDFLKRQKAIKQMQDRGILLIFKKNKFKIAAGAALIGIGTITLPLPTGSVFLIAAGCYITGISITDLKRYKEEAIRRIKLRWRYR